jgi:hypothetical protein
MKRPYKIALIGAHGYERQAPDRRVNCFRWDHVSKIGNLRDYDTIILNLLTCNPEKVDWAAFESILNPWVTSEITSPGGAIITLGDPRFSIRRKDREGKEVEEPFLNWSGLTFLWDNEAGDTLVSVNDYQHRGYDEYVKHLSRWDYSLRECELDLDVLSKLYHVAQMGEKGIKLAIQKDVVCRSRYQTAICFVLNVVMKRRPTSRYAAEEEIVQSLGPLLFLPRIDLDDDQTLMLVLKDLCGVESTLPEPAWITDIVAPGQKAIDDVICEVNARLESLHGDLVLAEKRRAEARACLQLLYERGTPLEISVRDILRRLGAHVEDPPEVGKEDGWITVQLGGQTFEGVLEIKSTKNDQFGEDGLRQLLDWVNRGVQIRQKKYKGIFIGNSAVDRPLKERPWAFSDNWKKSAEVGQLVALKSEDLYIIYILSTMGKVNPEELWREVFKTDGVFNSSAYRERLAPKEETKTS